MNNLRITFDNVATNPCFKIRWIAMEDEGKFVLEFPNYMLAGRVQTICQTLPTRYLRLRVIDHFN